MARTDNHIIGLDVGTTQTRVIVAEQTEKNTLNVVAYGKHQTRGMRKGVVINLDATIEAIREAVKEAEFMADVTIDRAYVSVDGGHLEGFNSKGVIGVSGRNKEITASDVQRAVNAAKMVNIPNGREILHVIPREFKVDTQSGIGDPVGMRGEHLEVKAHIITGSTTFNENLLASVNRADIDLVFMVAAPLAAAENVLSRDEKDLGVVLVDIGGGTTDIAVFQEGGLVHTSVLTVGGDYFTNDIAVGLRAPISEAERIKKTYGCACRSKLRGQEILEVGSMGGRKPRRLTRQLLSEIIQPRAEELMELVQTEIQKSGHELNLNSGAVLTGGGSLLEGLTDVAEQKLEIPARRGIPTNFVGMEEEVASPEFATALGLTTYALTHPDPANETSGGVIDVIWQPLRKIFNGKDQQAARLR